MTSRYVTREEMDAEAPGVYDLLPGQFRDRLPADVYALPKNALIFRATFEAMPRLVNELFAKLDYTERTQWPMWKLVAAFYLGPSRAIRSTSYQPEKQASERQELEMAISASEPVTASRGLDVIARWPVRGSRRCPRPR